MGVHYARAPKVCRITVVGLVGLRGLGPISSLVLGMSVADIVVLASLYSHGIQPLNIQSKLFLDVIFHGSGLFRFGRKASSSDCWLAENESKVVLNFDGYKHTFMPAPRPSESKPGRKSDMSFVGRLHNFNTRTATVRKYGP